MTLTLVMTRLCCILTVTMTRLYFVTKGVHMRLPREICDIIYTYMLTQERFAGLIDQCPGRSDEVADDHGPPYMYNDTSRTIAALTAVSHQALISPLYGGNV
jgi:hypothetical protein